MRAKILDPGAAGIDTVECQDRAGGGKGRRPGAVVVAVRKLAVELARDWRMDRALRRLEAMLVVGDPESLLVVSGNGDVIEPDDGIAAIGSGGSYALAAARALVAHTDLDAEAVAREALRIASEICIYTNDSISVVSLP